MIRRPNVNPKLIPLKGLLFTFFCGFGCLWPFFTVHQKQLGLSIQETAIINLVLPFLAAVCAPFLATFVDKLGNYSRALVIACLLMGFLYTTLLFIPPVIQDVPYLRQSELFLLCSADGSAVAITKSNDKCVIPPSKISDGQTETEFLFVIRNCTVLCTEPSTNMTVDATQMCLSKEMSTDCRHVESKVLLSVKVRLNSDALHSFDNLLFSDTSHCFYAVDQVEHRNDTFNSFTCPTLRTNCMRICQAIETADASVLPTSSSVPMGRHWMLTFWSYIITRALADILFTLSFPLTDAISLTVLRQHGGSFGRQMLFGILALGIAGPVAGVLNDAYSGYIGESNYLPSFVSFDVLMGITIILVMNIPFTVAPQPKGVYLAILKLLKDVEVLALYISVVFLGTNFGFLETFLYWFLQDLGASQFLIGVTWTVGVFPSLPFLYKSQEILEKVGHANLLAFAFIVYAIRHLGYSFIYNPWWCLPFESIEVFTFFLTRATFCTYSALLTPPSLTVTSQTMMVSLHLMIGKGLGSLIGGFCMASFGPRIVFRGMAAFCVTCGVSYFLLYHLRIKGLKANRKPVVTIGTLRTGSERERNQLMPDKDDKEICLSDVIEPVELDRPTIVVVPVQDNVHHVTDPFLPQATQQERQYGGTPATSNGRAAAVQEKFDDDDGNFDDGKFDGRKFNDEKFNDTIFGDGNFDDTRFDEGKLEVTIQNEENSEKKTVEN